MSLGGFKKQFNKTSQYLSEKVGGNKGSELDEDFIELGRKLDVINECVENMQDRTKEYLQPNPNARTKMAAQLSYQKARGHDANTVKYPQPEMELGNVFLKYGSGLNDMSPYASSLVELGSSFNEMSKEKDSMVLKVTENVLDPLYEIQQKDLKEIYQLKKKLEGRRLDYDYKKGKGEKVAVEEMQAAEDKFIESKHLCYNHMKAFVENDVEHVHPLNVFSDIIRDYHKQCADIMELVTEILSEKLSEARSQARKKKGDISEFTFGSNNDVNSQLKPCTIAPIGKPPRNPCCRALYDFDAENEGDLEFNEGDMIALISRVDENWLEGSCKGKSGCFPENYVEIVVPL